MLLYPAYNRRSGPPWSTVRGPSTSESMDCVTIFFKQALSRTSGYSSPHVLIMDLNLMNVMMIKPRELIIGRIIFIDHIPFG